jgi:hypothetical protein
MRLRDLLHPAPGGDSPSPRGLRTTGSGPTHGGLAGRLPEPGVFDWSKRPEIGRDFSSVHKKKASERTRAAQVGYDEKE